MKKKEMEEWVEIFEKSLEVKPKKLDPVWHAIHELVDMIHVRHRLYVKAREKKGKKPWDLKTWLECGQPEK